MKLENNFSLSEFRCKDGTDVPEEYMDNVIKLAKNLQVLREHLNRPIRVISGYRSPRYNSRIGGARKSQHMTASAADIQVPCLMPSYVKKAIVELIKSGKMDSGGIGLYTSFTHYDIRGRNARWFGRGTKDDN